MKHLLIILFILIGFAASAQSGYTKIPSRYSLIAWKGDSTAHIPAGCGTPSGIASLRGGFQGAGALFIDSCANIMYVWNHGIGWTALATGVNYGRFGVSGEDDSGTDNRLFTNTGGYVRIVSTNLTASRYSIMIVDSNKVELTNQAASPSTYSSTMSAYRDSIVLNPHLGLINIDTLKRADNMTNKSVMVWDSTSGGWQRIDKDSVGGGGGVSQSVITDTLQNYWRLYDGNNATAGSLAGSWLGTKNNVSLRFRTNNTERFVLDSIALARLSGTLWFTSGNTAQRSIYFRHSDTTSYYIKDNTTNSRLDILAPGMNIAAGSGALTLGQASTTTFFMANSGKIAIGGGIFSPSAKLELAAGTTAAGTAPLKITTASAALMTAAEAGAVEVLVDSIYFTGNGGTRRRLAYTTDISTPTLEQVTTAGNSSTNSILIKHNSGISILDGADQVSAALFRVSSSGGGNLDLRNTGQIKNVIYTSEDQASNVNLMLPNTGKTSDTVAALFDVRRGNYYYASTATGITLNANHNIVEVTATGQTITLPTAVGITGKVYTVKLTASGSCTVGTTSSQNIDASTTYSLSAQYKYVTVQSNGANWIVIANN